MIHWFRTIDYCFRFSFFFFYLLTYVNFLQFLDNDDRMSSKRRNLSALVFLIKIKLFSLSLSIPGPSANEPIRMLSLVPRDRIGPIGLPCISLDIRHVGESTNGHYDAL